MAQTCPTAVPVPSATTRRVVSWLIALHFLAILTAVTSASTPQFPAPAFAVLANRPCQPYLQATFLANAYRFYAPDPGAPSILWFRLQYEDRSVRWLELPRRTDHTLVMAYERYLSLGVLLSQQVTPSPTGEQQLSDLGRIGLASYIRHLAATRQRLQPDGSTIPLRSVGVYSVQHASREPAQVRKGWEVNDLRTYRGAFFGAYDVHGERTDEPGVNVKEQPMAFVAAGIVAVDVWPITREAPDAQVRIDELELPAPVRRLLERFPELRRATMKPADLQKHVERLVTGADET